MRKAAGILFALLTTSSLAAAAPGNGHAWVAGRYGIELDGKFAGWVSEVDGGHAVSDVVVEKVGGDALLKKHIGGVKYEDFTIVVDEVMSPEFYNWVAMAVDLKTRSKARANGAIVHTTLDGQVRARREFTDGLITEVSFPALDAASKDAAKMTIKFSPERATTTEPQQPETIRHRAKAWMVSNFRLRVDGLDEPCRRVNKIEAIVVKQKIAGGDNNGGGGKPRDYDIEPTKIEFPDLVITLPESDSKPLSDWYQTFAKAAQDSKGSDAVERQGTLELLAEDNKTVLLTVAFHNLGVYGLAKKGLEAVGDAVKRNVQPQVTASMYSEGVDFGF